MTAAPPAAGAALELILRATLLIAAAWAGAAILRRVGASAAARHLAWQAGIFALLALPPAWWLTPPLPLPFLPPEQVAAAIDMAPFEAPPAPEGMSPWDVLLLFYLLGVAAVLLRFALSRLLVARLWRRAEPARDEDWQAQLAGLSAELGLSRPVRLRLARSPAMPMTWGTLAPRILLPADAGAWPAERRRLVLLHELAHVARRDSLGRSAASLACALYWFHPGAWLAARRLRLEQEHATDDRVLQAGAQPKNYARNLLDLAFSADAMRGADHAAAMAGMGQLEQRMVSITSSARRDAPGPAFHAASATVTLFTLLGVAAALPVRPLQILAPAPALESALPSPGPAPEPGGGIASGETDVPAQMPPVVPRESQPQRPGGLAGAPAATMPRVEAEPVVLAAQDRAAVPAQEVPPPARTLGPIGPRLQPLPEEQDTDPRIPAALRRVNAAREADLRAGPGPPRTPAEGLLRTLPATILQARGILPSR